jgi:phage-related protein
VASPAPRPLRTLFFRTEAGNEPVREWLLGERIARTFFIVVDEEIILLHGIIKKSRTAPKQELDLARKRQASYMKEHRK